jgi:iron complex outermembrane receptor protein
MSNDQHHSAITVRSHAARPKRTALAQAVSVAVLATVGAQPLKAQQLEEVIVTATKRAESVMDVPLSITAMSGNQIREVNLNDVKDLITFTPGISGNSKDSFLDFVSVRGIRTIDFGNGGDPSVSLYKNGLYQGRTGSAVSSLYDVERAEVLRGPQGFLFGRNSVSGAMNIITTKPNVDQVEGYAELDVGERDVIVFEGGVNLPINDNMAVRIAAFHSEEDGYVDNLFGGPDLIEHENQSFRITGRYENDRLTADLMFEYDDRDQFGTVYRATGEGRAFNFHQTRINGGVPIETSRDGRTGNNDNSLQPTDEAEIYSVGLFIDYDMGFATLTSLTGYKDHEYQYVEDYDGVPTVTFNYGQDQEGDYFEQELRLTSNGDGPLDWYAGASYYQEDIDTIFLGQQEEDVYCLGYWYNTCQDLFDYYNYLDSYYGGSFYCDYYLDYYFGSCDWTPSPTGLINDRNRIEGKYEGYSAYVDLKYALTDSFDVNAGLRYSYDEKEFSQEVLFDPSLLAYKAQTGFTTPEGALTDKQDWDDVTWRLVANWRPDDDTLIFGSVATGYKPGGFGSFNIEGPGADCGVFGLCVGVPGSERPGDFGPETVTSYEIGYKSTLFDGTTQTAITGFYYQYEDLQAIFSEGPRQIVDNIGEVDGWGIEAEVSAALGNYLTLRLGASWFDSEANDIQPFCGAGEVLDPVRGANACEGNSIPWAPEYTAFAVLSGIYPMGGGEAFGTLSWSWEDDYRGDWPDESLIYQRIEALNQTDIVLGYRQESWSVSAYVENVFDQEWYDGNYADDPTDIQIYPQHTFGPARPRTAGVRLGYEF